MYESYYSLHKNPFPNHTDGDSIYFSDKHKAALAVIKYCLIDPMDFTVLVGLPGTGKSTLLQYVRSTVKSDHAVGIDFTIGFVSDTSDFGGQLTQGLLATYGLDATDQSRSKMHEVLREYLIEECYKKGRQPFLVVDQAEKINASSMEELGELSNISSYRGKSLQFILAGQYSLANTLRLPRSSSINRRIGQTFTLKPLNLNETIGYIQHRLNAAGAEGKAIFDDAACEILFELAKGIPRNINKLCDVALAQGYEHQKPFLDKVFIDEILRKAHQINIADEIERDLNALDVPDVGNIPKPESAEESDIEDEPKLALKTGTENVDSGEWRVSNPWEKPVDQIRLFEMDRWRATNSDSRATAARSGTKGALDRFYESDISEILRENKANLFGMLTVMVGALFGFLLATYFFGSQNQLQSSKASPPESSEASTYNSRSTTAIVKQINEAVNSQSNPGFGNIDKTTADQQGQ